jgi:carbonic anhydrase/acetyltransferase-like protein (isoleucine patch superfamily)
MSTILSFKDIAPVVAADAFVAQTATLIGEVEIGAETGVWYGCVLRGDVGKLTVGARTSIQDNTVMHASDGWTTTSVGDDCTVGHACILHGCRVHDRVLVGMGSILLDEAEIASDTILGAGSLVTIGTKIPSGVLAMGRPARVVRDLKPEELEQIRDSAAHYVEKTAAYLATFL